MRSQTIAAAAALALGASLVGAQATPAPSPQDAVVPMGSLEAVAAMKSLLRNLVTLQEKYWYDHGRYAADVAALGLSAVKKGEPLAQVIVAGSFGWAAQAQHPLLSGRTCVVYVGNGDQEAGGDGPATSAQKLRATAEGAPTCDEVQDTAKAGGRR